MDSGFIAKLFGRDEGGYSTLRWVYVWTYGFVVVVVFGVWAAVFWVTQGKADIPMGVAGLAGTIIAIISGNKYMEKREEMRNAVVPKPQEPSPSGSGGGSGSDVGGAGGAKG